MVVTGATFADAAPEYLRYVEHDRERKPWTRRGYRSAINAHLLPAFGSMAVEDVTTEAIEAWIATVDGSIRTRNKLLILLHGILRRARKVYGLPFHAAAEVQKHPQRRSGDIDVFSPEEVWALARTAESAQDAAIFLTAAFTGLRQGELPALRWRDVDFTGCVVRVRGSYGLGEVTTPKSGKVGRSRRRPTSQKRWLGWVPVTLRRGGRPGVLRRRRWPSRQRGAAPALQGRARRGELRPLRFHDLRHTFGTRMIAEADIRRVQEWMGHADIQTTMRYLHYAPRAEDAATVARAFRVRSSPAPSADQADVDPQL
jgi:integrase